MCRVRDNSAYTVNKQRSLTDEDKAASVLSGEVVSLGIESVKAGPDHPVRLIVIKANLHNSKGRRSGRKNTGSTGQGSDGLIRIATDMLDVPAEFIALMYDSRWTIEIFFCHFKHVLGCRHPLSHSQNSTEL